MNPNVKNSINTNISKYVVLDKSSFKLNAQQITLTETNKIDTK